MKRKLTITVDAELLQMAKRDVRSRGVSLSSLVEKALRQVAGDQAPFRCDSVEGPVSGRWP